MPAGYNVADSIIGDGGNLIPNLDYDANKSGKKDVEIVVPLRHLGNFWNSLSIPLVNCAVSLILTWSANCVITTLDKRILVEGQKQRVNSPTYATFAITDTRLYVPVIILSAENDNCSFRAIKDRI